MNYLNDDETRIFNVKFRINVCGYKYLKVFFIKNSNATICNT